MQVRGWGKATIWQQSVGTRITTTAHLWNSLSPPRCAQGRHHHSTPVLAPNQPTHGFLRTSEPQAASTNWSPLIFVWTLLTISTLTQTFPWPDILNKNEPREKKESFWNNELVSRPELAAGSLTPDGMMHWEEYEFGGWRAHSSYSYPDCTTSLLCDVENATSLLWALFLHPGDFPLFFFLLPSLVQIPQRESGQN